MSEQHCMKEHRKKYNIEWMKLWNGRKRKNKIKRMGYVMAKRTEKDFCRFIWTNMSTSNDDEMEERIDQQQ